MWRRWFRARADCRTKTQHLKAGMTKLHLFAKRTATGALAISLGLTCVIASHAQIHCAGNSGRSRAVAPYQSRAERAAEEMVSLSADTIIGFLRSEPGLLLQAKRLLVTRAYEQGRLLDPKDLEDEALFRLVQEDQSVRVSITREIEERHYIQAKPRPEELEQGYAYKTGATPAPSGPHARNQQDAYWSKHEVAL